MDDLSKHTDTKMTISSLENDSLQFIKKSKSPATKAAYKQDWTAFETWCGELDLESLPASPHTVTLWITHMANNGRAVSSISRCLTAISQAHKFFNLQSPTTSPEVTNCLKGIKREKGTAQKQATPLVWKDLKKVIEVIKPNFLGRRDAALLLVGWAAALRRSEIVALDVPDIEFVDQGMVVTIRRSKTDQDGEGYRIGVPFASEARYCPVQRLKHWLDLSRITAGPIFFQIGYKGKWFHVNTPDKVRLSPHMINLIIKRHVGHAKLGSVNGYSGHSLRAGFITTAASKGTPEYSIQMHTRHRSSKVMRTYIRKGSLFEENPLSVLF